MRNRRTPHRAVNLPLFSGDRAALLGAASESGRSPSELIADAVSRALAGGDAAPRNFGGGDLFLHIELPAELVAAVRRRRYKVVHFIRWALSRQPVACA